MESSVPVGMWSATAGVAARAPSLADIRRGSFGSNGWEEGQRRTSTASANVRPQLDSPNPSHSSPIRGYKSPPISPLPEGKVRETRAEDEDDGFPDIIFGRGEMSDQSFVRGAKKTTPIPTQEAEREPIPTYNISDPDFDDLDDLDPRPKRRSKDVKAMLGGEPPRSSSSSSPITTQESSKPVPDASGVYPNGYSFPPKRTWTQATIIGLKAFWKFTLTPLGFFIVLYGLNVVAWGGMLFLLLCNAAPQMCYPEHLHGVKDCNDIDSPRRIWVEIDSQVVNALFCVTGFGLIPWRFRDWYYLIQWRVMKKQEALRKLAGIHNSWFRLSGSEQLPSHPDIVLDESDPALPLPPKKIPPAPLTGARAPPTSLWKLDYVILLFVANTFLQAVLSGFMWGLNRYDRPSWSTGLFVALASIVAAMAGIMQFQEGKKIKKVEGVPVDEAEKSVDVEKDGVRKGEKTKEGTNVEERIGRVGAVFG